MPARRVPRQWPPHTRPSAAFLQLSHAKRVYASLRRSSKDKRLDGALAWLRRHGGQASPRDVQRDGVAGVKNAKEALALLKELADQGYGVLEQRGKRSFRFTLGEDQTTSD